MKRSPRLFADETTAPALDPGRGRTKTGQPWAYAGDDRPWGGADPPAVAYLYAPDREAERQIEHLAGFQGVLQVDGYGGYAALARRGEVRLAFWAHARRRFYELAATGSSPPRAHAVGLRQRRGLRTAFTLAAPLREAGHEAVWWRAVSPGATDAVLLAAVIAKDLVVDGQIGAVVTR